MLQCKGAAAVCKFACCRTSVLQNMEGQVLPEGPLHQGECCPLCLLLVRELLAVQLVLRLAGLHGLHAPQRHDGAVGS